MKRTKATAIKKDMEERRPKEKSTRAPMDVATVRQLIAERIRNQAVEIVEMAIGETEKGQNAAMLKYLFELGGLYPATVQEEPSAEDSLAKTLLRRLGILEDPILENEVTKGSAPVTRDTGDTVE